MPAHRARVCVCVFFRVDLARGIDFVVRERPRRPRRTEVVPTEGGP